MKIKFIFFVVLFLSILSCENKIPNKKQISYTKPVYQLPSKKIARGKLEFFADNEKIIFNNEYSQMGIIYYDYLASPNNKGVNYQIGGHSDKESVICIALTNVKLGTYAFSRSDKKKISIDINVGCRESRKRAMVVLSDVGTITISKNDNNFLSGHFSGKGLKMVDTESLEMIPVTIQGKFEDIPLYKNGI